MLFALALFVAAGAQAQTPACEQYKATLAARFDASGVSGYALEAIATGAPLPPGARVIGNCQGGAYNIVYRRWASVTAASGASAAAAPRPASAAVRPTPALTSTLATTAAPVASAAATAWTAATPASAGSTEDANPPVAGTPASAASAGAPARRFPGLVAFIDARWPLAVGTVLLLLLAAAYGIWRARYSPYDSAGLPRGPRL